jgi:hypothetical protein
MFVFDATALLTSTTGPDAGSAPRTRRPLPVRLLEAIAAQRRLQRRQRALPRPAGCGWLPRRAWRRHAALICLRAGIDPDQAAGGGAR